MKTYKLILAAIVIALGVPMLSIGAPQDSWYYAGRFATLGEGKGIDIGTNGLLYFTDYWNHRIQIWSQSGTYVTNWTGFSNPYDVTISTNGRVFVADTGNNRIKVFDHQGTSITNWGGSGSGDGQFNGPRGVAIGLTGLVFVADAGNYRIQVFDQNGNFIRKWGSAGTLDGQFSANTIGAEIGPDGLLYVCDQVLMRMQVFDEAGNLIRKWPLLDAMMPDIVSIGNDHIFLNYLCIRTLDGQKIQGPNGAGSGVAETADGTLYVCDGQYVVVYKRTYRTMDPPVRSAPPFPVVIRTEQRPGTAWMDIDYKIVDADSSNVAVGAIAYLNGSTGLSSVVKVSTFEENTQTNVGQSICANQQHRLTWNVAADLSTNYVNLQVEILAKDNRNLLSFDYITIPSNGPNPALTISSIPVNDGDMLYPWFWLVATNDPAINLVSGKVYGVRGAYTNQILASGVTTTSNGVDFLWERLHVRRATASEVDRAKTASSPGTINQWTPRNNVSGRPSAINEYGFDTGDSGYWVVPLP